MNEHIPCDLIQDVLPLYIEKLLSEQSESLVNEHLISCDCCREKYQLLSKTLPEESGGITKQEMSEIDYLKKINSYQDIYYYFAIPLVILLLIDFTIRKRSM